MLDTIDTRMISFNEPLPEGIVKMLDERAPWDADLLQETRGITHFRDNEYSQPSKHTYIPDKPIFFYDWLGVAAMRLPESRIVAIATTLLYSAKLSIDPQWTFAFDPNPIVKVISKEKSSQVSISPGLIMPRTQVRASSLLAPSGAYLTWVEMLAEDLDDRSK